MRDQPGAVPTVFGIDRKTVAKMLAFSVPPGYRRSGPQRRPKLEAFTGIIDRILEDDQGPHRKQRHTAKKIFERLRDEHGFTGGQTIVKDYVRERRRRSREMFVPLVHSPAMPRACPREGGGRFRRGDGGDRRHGAEGALLRLRPAAQRRQLREGL